MKKYFWIGVIIIIAIGALLLWRGNYFVPKNITPVAPLASQSQIIQVVPTDSQITLNPPVQLAGGLPAPLDKAKERVTKKPFGIFITPKTSPVQPEKFQGYHTGTDFEIFPEELNMDVTVKAICPGKIVMKKSASGYGGVLVQNCTIDSQIVTVIYGHLKIASIVKNSGDNLAVREVIGILGAGNSIETAGERKHLHLGIHKGAVINILGYVQTKNALNGWLDPCVYVCQ